MPSLTRRRLLGGGAAVLGGGGAIVAGALGARRLDRGATDAEFASWTPVPGTWPLRRYDPANTAHNPNATPPREAPRRRAVVAPPTTARRPRFYPIAGPDHVAVYGDGFAVYPPDSGKAVRATDAATSVAGFGPDGRLHTVRQAPGDSDQSTALVGYDADELRETYRFPFDIRHPTALIAGTHEAYVGTDGDDIRVVDYRSGRRWKVDGTVPALADGRLYAVGALAGTVAYAPRTGLDRHLDDAPKRIWSGHYVPGFNHPAVAGGRLVIGNCDVNGGVVAAFDTDTGELLWEPRSLGVDIATPAVVGDRAYTAVGTAGRQAGFGLDAGLVVALDLATGETVWRDEVSWPAHTPVVGSDTLVVAGQGAVRAYDRGTGDVLWTRTFEVGDIDGLALVEDRVLVTSETSLYELA